MNVPSRVPAGWTRIAPLARHVIPTRRAMTVIPSCAAIRGTMPQAHVRILARPESTRTARRG